MEQPKKIGQSRDCLLIPRYLEIGMQFPDFENGRHDLKTAQIPSSDASLID